MSGAIGRAPIGFEHDTDLVPFDHVEFLDNGDVVLIYADGRQHAIDPDGIMRPGGSAPGTNADYERGRPCVVRPDIIVYRPVPDKAYPFIFLPL